MKGKKQEKQKNFPVAALCSFSVSPLIRWKSFQPGLQ